MPLYEFYNEELGESYEMMMTIANKEKYLKKNLFDDEIIIGMGAGSISKFMRELKNTL